jgi:hypothetical protein
VFLIARFWPEIAKRRAPVALFAAMSLASILIQALGAFVYPTGFNEGIDRDPERLWLLRDAEIPRLIRKLVRGSDIAVAPASPASIYVAVQSRVPTPRPRWWTQSKNDEGLSGSLDWPRPNAVVAGDLRISGWAGSSAGRIDVQVLLSPGEEAVGVTRGPRADVCQVIPAIRDCSSIGFAATVSRAGPKPAEYVIVAELRGPKGTVRRLAPVRFFWR